MSTPALPPDISIRNDLRPGDLGSIIHMHGTIYAREYGFDHTFDAYVAEPLAQFVLKQTERERIWLAERDGKLVGCIAIVSASEREAQLRWFLVDPSARGIGLGKRLLNEAIAFAREQDYSSIFLYTVSALTTAAKLYRLCGFERVEARALTLWGMDVIDERYVLNLPADL